MVESRVAQLHKQYEPSASLPLGSFLEGSLRHKSWTLEMLWVQISDATRKKTDRSTKSQNLRHIYIFHTRLNRLDPCKCVLDLNVTEMLSKQSRLIMSYLVLLMFTKRYKEKMEL